MPLSVCVPYRAGTFWISGITAMSIPKARWHPMRHRFRPKREVVHDSDRRPATDEPYRLTVERMQSCVFVASIETALVGGNPKAAAEIVYIPRAETTDAQMSKGRRRTSLICAKPTPR